MYRAWATPTITCVDRDVDCSVLTVAAREYEGGPVYLFGSDPRCLPSDFIVDDAIEPRGVACKLEL